MTDAGPESGASDAALSLFEEFLEQHHSGGADFAALCAAHPEHAERFRRWWGHLSEVGEVNEDEGLADREPDEGDRFGPYRVIREIGRGAQGTVFLAEDTRLSRRVALKVLPRARLHGRDPQLRFAREAELASRLDHPGLCTVFERGVHGETAFLAMRLVEGETLAAAIARAQRRTETTARRATAVRLAGGDGAAVDERDAVRALLTLFEKVARALHAAHEAQLVHRDVKPGNIMIDARGEPVLLDFGLARDVEDDAPALTRTGDTVGTPAYMAPEQLQGCGEVDRRADVYALAATLYECVTLRRPVEAATRAELYRRIVDVEPLRARRLNPTLARDLETVLDTALQKNPTARYRTAEDLGEDLRRVRQREPILARPAGPLVRGWRWAQRNPAVAASVAAVFASLAIGLSVSVWLQAETARAQAEEQRMLGRLTDGVRIEDAQRAARALFPISEARADALTAWLAMFGEPLAAALPGHRAELEALRRRALAEDQASLAVARAAHPAADELTRIRSEIELCRERLTKQGVRDRARPLLERFAATLDAQADVIERKIDAHRPYRFSSRSDQALHDALARLVAQIDAFVGPGGLLDRMRAHQAWASGVRAQIEGPDADAWEEVRTVTSRADGPHGGKTVAPQPGFVPLGIDPRSELLEFAFERSGDVPARDPATGALSLDDRSAVIFVLLPGGRYRMGRPQDSNPVEERFEREVGLAPFLIARHELSRRQWTALSGREPPDGPMISTLFSIGPDHPIDFVSWHEAVTVLGEFGLELPTEAQWEYAAAGGTRTRWWWGDSAPTGDRLWDNLRYWSSGRAGTGGPALRDGEGLVATAPTHAVFAPNPFGLVAVHGNVAEWCREPFIPRTPLDRFEVREGDGELGVPSLGLFAVRGGSFDTRRGAETVVSHREGKRGTVGHIAVGVRPIARIR